MKFEEYSRTFLHFYTGNIPEILEKHLDTIASRNPSIVDLGCGDGDLLIALLQSKYVSNAKRVVGVDLAPERIERLKCCTDVEAYCGDVTNVEEVGDGEIDLIVCTQVIEHVPDDNVLLKEISRQLKVGGIAYVASLVKKKYGWFYYRTKHGKWALDPTHEREYCSQEEFEALFRKAGFSIVETKMTLLKLSFIEFIIRRAVLKMFKFKDINSLFVRHPMLDTIRRVLMVPIIGYYFIDIIVEKKDIIQ